MSSHNGADSRPITEQLAEARARVELARAGHELARLERRTKKLTESNLLWDWQSGYQDLLDRLRTDEGRLLLAPSTVQDRLYGSNWPFWRTWQEHSVIRAQARFICTTSDIARGALNGLCAYVIGRDGYTHVVEPRKGQDPPKDLLHCLQRIADDTAELNNLPEFEKESFRRSRRDGESLDRDYLRDDGLTEFEWIEPEQLLDDPSLPIDQGSFGVCTAPGRVTKIETFHVCYDGNSADGEHVPAEEVRFIKIGTDSTIKRGLSDFAYDVYERIKVAGRCVQNMTESAAIQSAVAEILEHETATPEVAQAFDDSEADYQTPNPWTGQQTNNRRVTPGESRKIPKGLKYVPPPFSDGLPAWDQTVRRALATVAVVWNAPEWLVSSDTSANAYANAVEAQAPFRRRCESEQSFYRHHFRRRIVRALKNACEAGKVRTAGRTWTWDEVRRLCEVQSEPPSLEVRKPLEEAQTNQIRLQAKVLSPQQWCQEDGRDYEETVREIEAHTERTGGQGQPMGPDDDLQPGQEQQPQPGQGGGLDDLLGGGDDEPEQPVTEARRFALDLVEQWEIQESGFSGVKTGKNGVKRCYSAGKQVPCPHAEPAPVQKKTGGEAPATPATPAAPAATAHPGAAHGSTVSVKPAESRAWGGKEPVAVKTALTKQETGRVGEAVGIAWLKAQGKDARPMNSAKTNFPVDALEDHRPTELKAGLCSNSRGAQQWRLTFSKESATEKADYEQLTPEERTAWNADKQRRIHERKEAVIKALEEENPGEAIHPRTLCVVLNPDTRTADIFEFDGFHDRIDWQSDLAKKGYRESVTYE